MNRAFTGSPCNSSGRSGAARSLFQLKRGSHPGEERHRERPRPEGEAGDAAEAQVQARGAVRVRVAADGPPLSPRRPAPVRRAGVDSSPEGSCGPGPRPFLRRDSNKSPVRSLAAPGPGNGYSLYCAELMVNMKDVPSTERMVLCSKQWKVMSPKEKDMYQKRCEQKKKLYESEIQRFLESLPDEERERVLLEEKIGGSRIVNNITTNTQSNGSQRPKPGSPTSPASPTCKSIPERPQQPISAMFLFFQEQRKDNPDLTESELTRQLARMWNELSERKREKYKKMERALKAEHERKMQNFLKEKKDAGAARKGRLPETPRTAEEIWEQTVISDYTAKHWNDRKKAQSAMEAAWKAMEKKEKIRWIKKAADDQRRYERELTESRWSPASAQHSKKLKFNGEPKKPPMSGYQMFSQELLTSGELSHFGLKERMVEIGKRWQNQSQAQKDGYKKLVEEQQQEYKIELELWLKSLSPQERSVYKEYMTSKRKGPGKPGGPAAKVKATSQLTSVSDLPSSPL
ncbi:nucleolar transcription factor 1-like [Heterodontus francisci]|uniref:nucleolar transcription factor 1-like n=1 Tax=Heterodontus francisci TaxID=7792 RepID=UPI00355B7C24